MFSGVVFMSTIFKIKILVSHSSHGTLSREGAQQQHVSEHVALYTPSQPVQQHIYFRNVDILISSDVCISFGSHIALQQMTAEGRGGGRGGRDSFNLKTTLINE